MKYHRLIVNAAALTMLQHAQQPQAKAATKPAPTTPARPPVAPAAAAAPPRPPATPAPAAPVAAAAPATPAAPRPVYEIEVGGPPPERKGGFGDRAARGPSPVMAKMQEMPLPEGGAYAQFFEPVPEGAVANTITDETERSKAFKEATRKLVNNLGGISRRIKKRDATFAVTMRETVENGVHGVRVWRIEAPVPGEPAGPTAEGAGEAAPQ